MSEAATQFPVVWKTSREVASRLLGIGGQPIFERTVALAQNLAAERRWPLKTIRIEFYQDPEIVWEYLLIVLVFDCGSVKAESLWDEFLNATEIIEQGLDEEELDLFVKTISYEFECSSQL